MVDAAVIGGGPAGCAAALALRAAGASTIVIAPPRARDKPTETAVPRLGQLLHSLGAADAMAACEPCYGIESNWGSPGPALRPSITDPHGHAWFVHRRQFDAGLARLAQSAGTEWLATEATGLHFGPEHATVRTPDRIVEARQVILATGSPPWTAKATAQAPVPVDAMVCYWSRLPAPLESRLLHVETTPHGWWYVCPGESRTTVACFVTDIETARTLRPRQLRNWHVLFQATRVSRQLGVDALAGRIEVVPVSVGHLAHRRGPRWIAIGDAAIKLAPLASCGTASALDAGRRAARVLVDGAPAAEQFDRWSAGLLAEFVRQRTSHYANSAAGSPGGFWARRNPARN